MLPPRWLPLSWIEFNGIHPTCLRIKAMGYHEIWKRCAGTFRRSQDLADISFKPNSRCSQAKYAGLLVIRDLRIKARVKDIGMWYWIPLPLTGPIQPSAVMAGNKVVVVGCDDNGNINVRRTESQGGGTQGKPGRVYGYLPVDARGF